MRGTSIVATVMRCKTKRATSGAEQAPKACSEHRSNEGAAEAQAKGRRPVRAAHEAGGFSGNAPLWPEGLAQQGHLSRPSSGFGGISAALVPGHFSLRAVFIIETMHVCFSFD